MAKKGQNTPQSEGFYHFLQDRNVFSREGNNKCPHCQTSKRTVDHLATNCGRLLPFDYVERHNEVLRCIHLNLCRQYKFTENERIKLHKVTKSIENKYARIVTDMPILTDIRVTANKPDIVVYDKLLKEITIIEVGIISQANLQKLKLQKKKI